MKVIEYETVEDLKFSMNNKSYEISKGIIEGIKENKNKTDKYLLLSLYAKDVDTYLDVTVSPNDYEECLKLNLKIMEREEDYEGCMDVIELMKYFNIK